MGHVRAEWIKPPRPTTRVLSFTDNQGKSCSCVAKLVERAMVRVHQDRNGHIAIMLRQRGVNALMEIPESRSLTQGVAALITNEDDDD